MNPKELVAILTDASNDFDAWYQDFLKSGKAPENVESVKDCLSLAYTSAISGIMAKLTTWLEDSLYSGKDAPSIPKGEGFDEYMKGAIYRRSEKIAKGLINLPLADAIEKNEELAYKLINGILEGYSGKVLKNNDDDDGINGIENDKRMEVMTSSLAGITYVKEGILNKKGLANAFRRVADFYDEEW